MKLPVHVRAFEFAREAHKGQKRKYTNEPYIQHCCNVANIVAELREGDFEMIAAAYLHDVVEDCGITYAELVDQFGDRVAAYVLGLTDVYTKEAYPHLNRTTRKEYEAKRFKHVVNEVKTIKLADLIDNTSSIVQYDPKFAKVYLKEKEEMLKYLIGGNPELYERAKSQVIV